jgi:hypothetical protein
MSFVALGSKTELVQVLLNSKLTMGFAALASKQNLFGILGGLQVFAMLKSI